MTSDAEQSCSAIQDYGLSQPSNLHADKELLQRRANKAQTIENHGLDCDSRAKNRLRMGTDSFFDCFNSFHFVDDASHHSEVVEGLNLYTQVQ